MDGVICCRKVYKRIACRGVPQAAKETLAVAGPPSALLVPLPYSRVWKSPSWPDSSAPASAGCPTRRAGSPLPSGGPPSPASAGAACTRWPSAGPGGLQAVHAGVCVWSSQDHCRGTGDIWADRRPRWCQCAAGASRINRLRYPSSTFPSSPAVAAIAARSRRSLSRLSSSRFGRCWPCCSIQRSSSVATAS